MSEKGIAWVFIIIFSMLIWYGIISWVRSF